MFRQTFSADSIERKPPVFRASNSKSKIRIEKGKLPVNFFRPLTIVTTDGEEQYNKQLAPTPCFGSHQQQQPHSSKLTNKVSQKQQSHDKQQFYSWFKKSYKPLSSRVQTVPAQMESSKEKKRHASERKTRLERVRSVRQEGNKSVLKIFKRYEHLISGEVPHIQGESYYKFRIKPSISQSAQKTYKNQFKVVNWSKRGYAETKYKQAKALNSINAEKHPSSLTLPLISNE